MSDKLVPHRGLYLGSWQVLSKEEDEAAWATYWEFKKRTNLVTRTYCFPEDLQVFDLANKPLLIRHNLGVLRAFRETLGEWPELLVLDRHHQCFRLDVSISLETLCSEEEVWGMKTYAGKDYFPLWRQPVIPEGNSVSFFSPIQSVIYEYEYTDDPVSTVEVTGKALIEAIDRCGSPLLSAVS